jgi:hypothetical protein
MVAAVLRAVPRKVQSASQQSPPHGRRLRRYTSRASPLSALPWSNHCDPAFHGRLRCLLASCPRAHRDRPTLASIVYRLTPAHPPDRSCSALCARPAPARGHSPPPEGEGSCPGRCLPFVLGTTACDQRRRRLQQRSCRGLTAEAAWPGAHRPPASRVTTHLVHSG